MITVVSGNPRSGTSMMMAMLEAGGVPCCYEQRADAHNPGGYFEHRRAMAGDLCWVPDGHAVKCLQMLALAPDCNARVIIMRRPVAESLASQNRVAEVLGRRLFSQEYEQMLTGCLDSTRLWCAGRPHLEVWYGDVLRNPANECLRVQALLGRPLDLAAMAALVRRP